MSNDIRSSVYIEFTPSSDDRQFVEEWIAKLKGMDTSDVDQNIAYDSATKGEVSIITFDMYGHNGVNYNIIDEFKAHFEKYPDLLITCNEWISTDEGYFYEKIDGEIQ